MTSPPRTITIEDSEKLLSFVITHGKTVKQRHRAYRNYAMLLLMLDAGLRAGELIGLRIADLLYQHRPVTSIIIRPEISKSKRQREIPVSARLTEAIKYLDQYLWSETDVSNNGYAFPAGLARHVMTLRQAERLLTHASMASLGRPINPHVLRHTFATRMMAVTNIRCVMQLLGHSSLSSTQIYTHPSADDLRKAIDKVAGIRAYRDADCQICGDPGHRALNCPRRYESRPHIPDIA